MVMFAFNLLSPTKFESLRAKMAWLGVYALFIGLFELTLRFVPVYFIFSAT